MSEKEFNEICQLDEIAESAGGYVDFNANVESEIHYDYRAIIAYCKQHNIDPIDMTVRELQQFIVA